MTICGSGSLCKVEVREQMVKVKSVKIDGEEVYFFNSAVYIFADSTGYTLELDMIVSEVRQRKYENEENLIIEMELEDGRVFSNIMHVRPWPGKLPGLTLFCGISSVDEYPGFAVVGENDVEFPDIEAGITLEEIRKVEMPFEKNSLRLNLPIERTEWLSSQKKGKLSDLFQEMIYDYWDKQRKETSSS